MHYCLGPHTSAVPTVPSRPLSLGQAEADQREQAETERRLKAVQQLRDDRDAAASQARANARARQRKQQEQAVCCYVLYLPLCQSIFTI